MIGSQSLNAFLYKGSIPCNPRPLHNNYRRAKFLTSLKQVSPDTVTAIEKAPEQPLDYGQAILEVESVAKTSPELSQIITELVKAIEAEPSLKELVNNTLKSQSQQASVINNQKLADSIKNVFQGNTFIGGNF